MIHFFGTGVGIYTDHKLNKQFTYNLECGSSLIITASAYGEIQLIMVIKVKIKEVKIDRAPNLGGKIVAEFQLSGYFLQIVCNNS